MDQVIIQLQAVFRRVLRQPGLLLSGEMGARDVKGWDSLAHINLVIAIEKEFKVRFKTADIAGLKNVREIAELIVSKQKSGGGGARPQSAEVTPPALSEHTDGIRLDRSNADDEKPTVVKIYATSGSQISIGESLFDIENSKATREVASPSDGILVHALSVGNRLPFGTTVARVVPSSSSETFLAAAMNELKAEKQFWDLQQTDPEAFELLKTSRAGTSEARQAYPRKLEEIKILSGGAGNTMMSVIGVTLGPVEVSRQSGDIFADKILDLVTFEAARLMRKYPKLNAAYLDNGVELHSAINAGVAFDEGERLVVYGIADADQKDLFAIRSEIEEALTKYVRRDLSPEDLSRATFAITDISSLNMDFIFPILPQGHSCIIGITRNVSREFALYVAYDHRVTEGLVAAGFLDELRQRILSFSQGETASPRCSFCERTLNEEVERFGRRGLLKVVNARGTDTLACHSCWGGG